MAIALALSASPAIAEPPADAPFRDAVKKSLTYLAKGGQEWMDGNNCASCHHAPLMIWSFHHAKQRGFAVDEEVLAEVTGWSLDPKVKWMPEPDAKKEVWSDKVLPVTAYFTLASDRAEPRPLPAETRATLVRHFLDKQEADGSWLSYVAHPPLLDCGETSTLYVLLALLGKDGQEEPADPDWSHRKARALEYLAKVTPGEEVQPKLWRLLLRKNLRESAASLAGSKAEDERAVLGQQHEDGGWGQTPALPSDAYATGQVLYFLAAADCQPDAEVRNRAVAFLLKNQQPDGSWVMASRPRTLPKQSAGARNLNIIRYAGTAWAAMGLVSTTTK